MTCLLRKLCLRLCLFTPALHLSFCSPPALSCLQLVLFGLSNQVVVTFKEENTMTFRHLFLKDYDESNGDSFAIYKQSDVYDHIFYAVEQVNPKEGRTAAQVHQSGREHR